MRSQQLRPCKSLRFDGFAIGWSKRCDRKSNRPRETRPLIASDSAARKMPAFGALQPVADHAAHGRSSPLPTLLIRRGVAARVKDPFEQVLIARREMKVVVAQCLLKKTIERPGWEERCHYAEILRIEGWLLARKGDPGRQSAVTSPRSTGRGSSRRNPGSSGPRPPMRSCCATRAGSGKPATCSRPSTAGSPKASRRRT
jgi:hypothetical protein